LSPHTWSTHEWFLIEMWGPGYEIVKLCPACCVVWMGQARGMYTFCLKCGVWGLLGWDVVVSCGLLRLCRVLQRKGWGGLAHPSIIKTLQKTNAGRSIPQHPNQTPRPHISNNTYTYPGPVPATLHKTQQHKHDTISQSHTPDPTTPPHINNDMAHTALIIPGYHRLYFAGLLPCTTCPPHKAPGWNVC